MPGSAYAIRMETFLAIASGATSARTLPSRSRPASSCGCSTPGASPGRRRNAQPWTFVVPGRADADRARSPRAVFVPENVLSAGLVVAILVRGKGPVLFDAGRAAQSMLLAAWADGVASCPNGIADPRWRPCRPRCAPRTRSGDRAVVRLPGRPRDPESLTADEWSERANRKTIDEVVRRLPR